MRGYGPFMGLDDIFTYRQAESCTTCCPASGAFNPVEAIEQSVQFLFRHARRRVLKLNDGLFFAEYQIDSKPTSRISVSQGILEQIREKLIQPLPVSENHDLAVLRNV